MKIFKYLITKELKIMKLPFLMNTVKQWLITYFEISKEISYFILFKYPGKSSLQFYILYSLFVFIV